jgi:hypothetical protein
MVACWIEKELFQFEGQEQSQKQSELQCNLEEIKTVNMYRKVEHLISQSMSNSLQLLEVGSVIYDSERSST